MYILGLDVERTARAVSNVRFEITTNEKIDASETSLRRRLRAPSDARVAANIVTVAGLFLAHGTFVAAPSPLEWGMLHCCTRHRHASEPSAGDGVRRIVPPKEVVNS